MKYFFRSALAVAVLSLSTGANAAYKYLDVVETIQEHSQWCGFATAVGVIKYREGSTNAPSQCASVNWLYNRSDACGNTTFDWSSSANSPIGALYGASESVQSILTHWSVGSTGYDYALSWSTIVSDVNNYRPFVIRIGWANGGGHVLIGYGYDDSSGTQRIGYMDPWPGEGWAWQPYSWLVSAPGDHTWTHSLRTS